MGEKYAFNDEHNQELTLLNATNLEGSITEAKEEVKSLCDGQSAESYMLRINIFEIPENVISEQILSEPDIKIHNHITSFKINVIGLKS